MSGKSQKPDARGGTFFLLPSCLVKSEAWRTASPRAIKALFVLWGRHNGFNNGQIAMNLDELAVGMDSQNHKGNARAMAELHARGMAVVERFYPKSSRLSTEYRLTFLPSVKGPATHDYLSWRPGDAGTRKKPVVKTATETVVSAAETATDRKTSVVETATERNAINGKPSLFPMASVADSTGHISNHVGASAERQSNPLKPSAAHQPNRLGAAPISAAPPVEELRDRALSHIDKNGWGSQGRLAKQAGIPVGTFSKFLNSEGPLSEQARIRLACAFPKTEEAERRARPAMARG